MPQIIEVNSDTFQVLAMTKSGVWLPIFIKEIDAKMMDLYHYPLLLKVEDYPSNQEVFGHNELGCKALQDTF
jgi:hypothetical protein